jgi:diguanylate cyclase (GGDEF)-like protein
LLLYPNSRAIFYEVTDVFVPRVSEVKQIQNFNDELFDIGQNVTIADAAQQMSLHQVGSLAVFDENRNFVGIITERDMLSKVLAKSLSPKETLVRDIMTSSVFSCTPQSSINEAESLMAGHQIRHLPILQDGRAVAMLSGRDLIAYRLKCRKDMQAAAEQLAMLPAGLKSLELEDVVSLAINEVPKSFGAHSAVLCLASKGLSKPVINCNNCRKSHKELLDAALSDKTPHSVRIQIDTTCNGQEDTDCPLSKLFIPLRIHYQSADAANNVINGFLCMCHPARPGEKPEESQLYKASLLQQILNINLTNAKLYQDYLNARRDSETDPLTGVGTRRVLENVLKAECLRSARYQRCFAVAIVDLDRFKQINDQAGHAAGDRILKQLAALIRRNVRETDTIVARYGGDEFVLVMPETTISGGLVLLERIRRQAGKLSVKGVQNPSISCGLTQWNPEPADSPETLMGRADSALYDAKRTGRNRVVALPAAELHVA